MINGLILMGTPPQGGGASGGSSGLSFLFLIIVMFVVMYFFMIRPQQKKEKQRQKMITELKKGDKVLTNSGMIGTIWGIKDNAFVIKFDEEVKIEFLKSAVSGKID